MNPAKRTIHLCALASVVVFANTSAHDLFVKPGSFQLEPGASASIPLMNGTFVKSEGSIAPDRLVDLSIVSKKGREHLDPRERITGEETSFVEFRAGAEGLQLIGVSLKPREITLSAADFDAYLEHDGIPDILEARRETKPQGEVLEVYEKHVKAVLRVGEATTGPFDTELGYPAEIVLLDNPYELTVGDKIRFRCLVDGRPVPNQFVLMGGERDGELLEEKSARTDQKGEARFGMEHAGKKYLRFIHMRESDQPGVDYHSKWATITFEMASSP